MKENGKKQAGVASPCAACKLLRRRCSRDCIFSPHFPADEPHKFASVHKVFGASNVSKMLQELPEHQRSDAVSAMVYEANARVRDPVYGCVGAISSLQQQVDILQTQLALAQAEVVQMRMRQFSLDSNKAPTTTTTTTTISAGSFENGSLHSTPYCEFENSSRSRFTAMEMIMDHHTSIEESLWSC